MVLWVCIFVQNRRSRLRRFTFVFYIPVPFMGTCKTQIDMLSFFLALRRVDRARERRLLCGYVFHRNRRSRLRRFRLRIFNTSPVIAISRTQIDMSPFFLALWRVDRHSVFTILIRIDLCSLYLALFSENCRCASYARS